MEIIFLLGEGLQTPPSGGLRLSYRDWDIESCGRGSGKVVRPCHNSLRLSMQWVTTILSAVAYTASSTILIPFSRQKCASSGLMLP